MGSPVSQNHHGDAIAEITDEGLDATQPGVKPSLTNAEQRPTAIRATSSWRCCA